MSDDLTGNEPESQPEQPPESQPEEQPEEQPESQPDSGHGESGSNHGRRLTIMIVASIILAIASSLIVPPIMFTDADRAAAEKIESEIWDLEQEMAAVQSKIEDLKGTLKNDEQPAGDAADQVRAEIDELENKVKDYQKQIADLREEQPSEESTVALFEAIGIGGEVFLRALTMMVVPLVMASVMSGILGMGDVRKLGRPGLVAILYYFSTTILAVVVGLAVVNVINPGSGFESDQEKFRQLDKNSDEQLDLAEFQENADEFEKTKSKRAFFLRDSDENGELSLNEFKGNNVDVQEVDRKKVVGAMSRESGLDKNKIEKIFPQLAKEKEEEGEEGDHFRS